MKPSLSRYALAVFASAAFLFPALSAVASPVPAGNVQSVPPQDAPCCGALTPNAQKILAVLDHADVEHLWLNHHHVNWETGKPDRPDTYSGPGNHTHCSAFAAAVGARRASICSGRLSTARFSWRAHKRAGLTVVKGVSQAGSGSAMRGTLSSWRIKACWWWSPMKAPISTDRVISLLSGRHVSRWQDYVLTVRISPGRQPKYDDRSRRCRLFRPSGRLA